VTASDLAQRLSAIVKAYDVRGLCPEQIDDDIALRLGSAFAEFLRDVEPTADRVLVGRDMRPSGVGLSAAFGQGLANHGFDVVDLGLISTDQLYFASGSHDAPGAVLTASHNPAQYNGIKMCLRGAAPMTSEGLVFVRDRAMQDTAHPVATPGSVSQLDVLAEYVEHVHSFIDTSALRSLSVVADTANGMGGLVVPAVFADLPVSLDHLFPELDGTFPNHPADPIQPENQRDLQARVLELGADIGLAFDGDADRVFIVDESVGHSFIKAKMAETGAAFAGEHSGHYYFRDNYRADSGLIAALVVLDMLSRSDRPLSELRKPFDRYAASGEINTQVPDAAGVIDHVAAHFEAEGAQLDRLDGLTVDLGEWWFNLRPSNTEPLLRLNLEAASEQACEARVAEIQAIMGSFPTP